MNIEAKDLITIITPIISIIISLFVLRNTEKLKSEVSRNSILKSKWADEFYILHHKYLDTIDDYFYFTVQITKTPDTEESTLRTLTLKQFEAINLEVRLSTKLFRFSVFSPKTFSEYNDCLNRIHDKIQSINAANHKSVVMEIFKLTPTLNILGKKTHEEMLK